MTELFQTLAEQQSDPVTQNSEGANINVMNTEWTGQQVDVPITPCPISDTDLDRLKTTYDPLNDTTDDLGKQLFMSVMLFIGDCQE